MTDEPDSAAIGCDSGESFALRVLGSDMAPEFNDGEIVIVEPEGLARDGSYVLARPNGEWMLRQLCQRGDGWALRALAAEAAEIAMADLSAVHGVVIQKAVPGRRRLSRFYR